MCASPTAPGLLGSDTVSRVPLLVHDRDLRGIQVRHAGRHQVHDGLHLAAVKLASWIQCEQYRRAGRMVVANESRRFGQGQMHARRAHELQAGNGVAQVRFQHLAIVRAFGQVAHAERRIALRQGRARGTALRQTLGGEFQSRFGQRVGRHRNGSAIRAKAERRVAALQGLGDGSGVFRIQPCVQQCVVGTTRPQHDTHSQGHGRSDADQQHQQACGGIAQQVFKLVLACVGGCWNVVGHESSNRTL